MDLEEGTIDDTDLENLDEDECDEITDESADDEDNYETAEYFQRCQELQKKKEDLKRFEQERLLALQMEEEIIKNRTPVLSNNEHIATQLSVPNDGHSFANDYNSNDKKSAENSAATEVLSTNATLTNGGILTSVNETSDSRLLFPPKLIQESKKCGKGDEGNKINQGVPHDEVPIKKCVMKNFDDYIENVVKNASDKTDESGFKKIPVKHQFLRKGQGTMKYQRVKKTLQEENSNDANLHDIKQKKLVNESFKNSTSLSENNKPASEGSASKLRALLPMSKLIMKKPQVSAGGITPHMKHQNYDVKQKPEHTVNDNDTSQVGQTFFNLQPEKIIQVPKEGLSDTMTSSLFNESQEMCEFEVLEQFVHNNVSFLSSISTVDRELSKHPNIAAFNRPTERKETQLSSPSVDETLLNKGVERPNNCTKESLLLRQRRSPSPTVVLSTTRKISLEKNCQDVSMQQQNGGIGSFRATKSDSFLHRNVHGQVPRGEYVPRLYASSGNEEDDETFDTTSDMGGHGYNESSNFHDEDCWNETLIDGGADNLTQDKKMKKHETKNTGENHNGFSIKEDDVAVSKLNKNQEMLSQLATKIFPVLERSALKTLPQNSVKLEKFDQANNAPVSIGVQSKILKEKSKELEVEIERFKKVNESVAQLMQEQTDLTKKLRKEEEEFERKKRETMAEFERYKNEEIQKIKKEKKIFEMYKKSHDALLFTKEDRKEKEQLTEAIEKLKEEMKKKEQKWKATSDRLKGRVEQLEKENLVLKDKLTNKEKEISSLKAKSKMKLKPNDKPWERYSFERHCANMAVTIPNPPCTVEQNCDLDISNSDRPERLCSSSLDDPIGDDASNEKFKQDSTSETSLSGVIERKRLPDGSNEIVYRNGTTKHVSSNGLETTTRFFNGDVKQTFADGRVEYFYANNDTKQCTYPDGLEIIYFSDGQIEKRFVEGNKEITFPDGRLKNISADGEEETITSDGVIIKTNKDGTEVVEFPNGQIEIHCEEFRRRIYPDGTVKTVFSNGDQETRYPSGRLRIKDKEGNVVKDTHIYS